MSQNNQSRTSHNARAEHAFNYITKRKEVNDTDTRTLARSFPTMIQNNGICAAVAFLQAKGKVHHKELYNNLEAWLKKTELLSDNLMKFLVEANRDEYRMVSKEALAYATWVKRFAEGMLSDEQ